MYFFTIGASAQLKFYRTYEDYVAKKSEDYKDFKMTFQLKETLYEKFKVADNDGQAVSIIAKDYWGFEYKGPLFRILTRVV